MRVKSADSVYIVRRNSDLTRALQVVVECLDAFEIAAIDRSVLEKAISLPGTDFEDNVQIACPLAAGLDGIVTREMKGFEGSPLPVMAPGEFLARLTPQEGERFP